LPTGWVQLRAGAMQDWAACNVYSLQCLSDETLLQIMECLDAVTLERLGSCSKQLYVTDMLIDLLSNAF
jgi:hypothetical protein